MILSHYCYELFVVVVVTGFEVTAVRLMTSFFFPELVADMETGATIFLTADIVNLGAEDTINAPVPDPDMTLMPVALIFTSSVEAVVFLILTSLTMGYDAFFDSS